MTTQSVVGRAFFKICDNHNTGSGTRAVPGEGPETIGRASDEPGINAAFVAVRQAWPFSGNDIGS